MATVKIMLAPPAMMGTMYTTRVDGKQMAPWVRGAIAAGMYLEESKLFEVNGDSQDAAEEVFDLTNNPSRQDERELVYGRGRSLSVGDIVVVGEERWLCASFGWEEV